MTWYKGSTQVTNIYYGSTAITNSYLGSTSGGGGLSSLAYDPVFLTIGDSQEQTAGDSTNADTLAALWPSSSKVTVANNTLAGAFSTYAPSTVAAANGRTGLNFVANKFEPGPEIGFIPRFLASYSNDLRLINLSAPGSNMGRGQAQATCTGYVSSGVSGVAGNVFTLSTGVMPDAGTLLSHASLPTGAYLASFGPGPANQRYICVSGVSGFGTSLAIGTSGAPVTFTKYGYSYSPTEGTLYNGFDGVLTNGYKTRILNALSSLVSAGKNPKIPAITIILGTNDMADTTAASYFSASISAFITQLRTDLASYLVANCKIIMVQAKSGAAGSATVQSAQQSIANADADIYLIGTVSPAPNFANFTLSDGTHYTCPSTLLTYTGRGAIGSAQFDIWTGASPGI